MLKIINVMLLCIACACVSADTVNPLAPLPKPKVVHFDSYTGPGPMTDDMKNVEFYVYGIYPDPGWQVKSTTQIMLGTVKASFVTTPKTVHATLLITGTLLQADGTITNSPLYARIDITKVAGTTAATDKYTVGVKMDTSQSVFKVAVDEKTPLGPILRMK